ncbi:MAG: DNA polymerase III subunit chi [Acetobacteraceae bacterium]|nr:DNA polymerase III subunit chi [Acetobacteraceae bacterium]
MADVGFYHLTRTTLDQALPALLGRTLAAGERAVILCASPERADALSKLLWDCREPDWLPNGTARSPAGKSAPALQPIWLTETEERPNQARFLFRLDGRTSELPDWTRIFDLFDGRDDPAVTAARTRWTAAKAAGHTLTYWKQTDRGWSKA